MKNKSYYKLIDMLIAHLLYFYYFSSVITWQTNVKYR